VLNNDHCQDESTSTAQAPVFWLLLFFGRCPRALPGGPALKAASVFLFLYRIGIRLPPRILRASSYVSEIDYVPISSGSQKRIVQAYMVVKSLIYK
jgi:hypothetical protein